MHAIAEILSDQDGMPEHLMYASGSGAAKVFEPFAFVVCNGCLAAFAAVKSEAVSLRTGSALPTAYGKMLQEEGGDGD
jgi:hypothetical protein